MQTPASGFAYGWKSLFKRVWSSRASKPFTVDERDPETDHWIEMGRFASKDEARVGMGKLVALGHDSTGLRVEHRPAEGE